MDDMFKIFQVMHSNDFKGVDFATYQLKAVAYQWYEEQGQTRGNDMELALWEELLGAFLDSLFSHKLREIKKENFVNLSQGG